MLGDFILDFASKMADAAEFPFPRDIPESIKKQTREYIENAGKQLEEGSGNK